MSALPVAVVALLCLLAGYRWYSRWLARRIFQVRADEPMPAIEQADDVDYVATRREVLWGHHFSSIAGAAPILGPAIAIIWGWLPALIWIVGGVIFMGAAHDFGALVLSIRHRGASIGHMGGQLLGPRARGLFLVLIFFLIWLVGAVFAFAIAGLFCRFPAAILPVNLEIAVAIGIGVWTRRPGRSLLLPSIAALVGLYLCIFGTASGLLWVPAPGSVLLSMHFWLPVLMVYALVASGLPVWLLLQPRDLINSHQLLVGLLALYVGFFVAAPAFSAPAVGELEALPALVPLLMITIACGAVSGFHGLVSSGTTSKQLSCATDARPIGYGAMLAEGCLAILATLAVACGTMAGGSTAWGHVHEASQAAGGGLPGVSAALAAFVGGSASFLADIGVPVETGATIVAVLVISFAATTLDTAMRIQRLVLAEAGETWKLPLLRNRWVGATIAAGSVLVLVYADFDHGAKSLWPVFGATNQVLAAFTMLLCAVYLRRMGRKPWPYLVPAIALLLITGSAMTLQVSRDLGAGRWLVGGVGGLIAILSIAVSLEGWRVWRQPAETNTLG